MPSPTDPIVTPIDPAAPPLKAPDVAALVAEVNGDLIDAAKLLASTQADAAAKYVAYRDTATAGDKKYAEILSSQETDRTDAAAKAAKATADAHGLWQAADAKKSAAESAFAAEIKYVVELAGGDPAAADPTPHAVPVPVPVPAPATA